MLLVFLAVFIYKENQLLSNRFPFSILPFILTAACTREGWILAQGKLPALREKPFRRLSSRSNYAHIRIIQIS